jgi:RimJ/RimL family protein N-acetyltransferase
MRSISLKRGLQMMTDSIFQGSTITLRPFEPDDVPALEAYLNHPELTGRRYIPWAFSELAPLSRKQVEEISQKWAGEEKSLPLAVVRRETGELIGHAECDWGWDPHCPSLAVVVAPPQQRRGYGSEVLGLLLRYLFAYTPAHTVSCWIADWNQPARQFAARHGFQENGQMRRAGVRQGEYFDVIVADMLRSEWQQLGGAPHAT